MNDLPEVLIPTQRTGQRLELPVLSRYSGGQPRPVRIFYDCEFLEDGRTIDLISIGMVVCEYDPRLHRYRRAAELYAVSSEAPWHRIWSHPWLAEHVLPSLPGEWGTDPGLVMGRAWHLDHSDPSVHTRAEIRAQVEALVTAGGDDVELWAWYGAYDHVVLCQLWGAMIDKPAGVPMYTHDLQQEADRQGIELPEQPSGEHNALEDARFNMTRARALGVIW